MLRCCSKQSLGAREPRVPLGALGGPRPLRPAPPPDSGARCVLRGGRPHRRGCQASGPSAVASHAGGRLSAGSAPCPRGPRPRRRGPPPAARPRARARNAQGPMRQKVGFGVSSETGSATGTPKRHRGLRLEKGGGQPAASFGGRGDTRCAGRRGQNLTLKRGVCTRLGARGRAPESCRGDGRFSGPNGAVVGCVFGVPRPEGILCVLGDPWR